MAVFQGKVRLLIACKMFWPDLDPVADSTSGVSALLRRVRPLVICTFFLIWDAIAYLMVREG